jgi:hypothetical protein
MPAQFRRRFKLHERISAVRDPAGNLTPLLALSSTARATTRLE